MKIAILATDGREFNKEYGRPRPFFGTAAEAFFEGIPSVPDLEVHILSCLKEKVAHTPMLAPNVYYHGLHVPSRGWVRKLYSECIRATRVKLGEIQPELVHAQGTERDCALSAAYSGLPSIVTIHGNMKAIARTMNARPFSFMWLQGKLETWAIRRTRGVICLTTHAQRQVTGRTRRTWILPNAVDQSFFDVQHVANPSSEIVFVASIYHLKNQNFVIRALDALAKERNDFRLVFFGKGAPDDPYVKEFDALVKDRPWCVHEGHKSPEEIRTRLGSARALILASHEENCPMSILEAMAIGVPVAASRAGGIPDLITDGENGLLFEPTNAESIRKAVATLIGDESLAKKMAAMGKKRALEQHHPTVIARKHLEIYRDALATK